MPRKKLSARTSAHRKRMEAEILRGTEDMKVLDYNFKNGKTHITFEGYRPDTNKRQS